MIDGKTIHWAGRDWVVPGLGLRAHMYLSKETIGRVHQSFVERAKGEKPADFDRVIDDELDVVFAALKRNYATLTREALESLLEMHNYPVFMRMVVAVLEQSFRSGEGIESGAPVNPRSPS